MGSLRSRSMPSSHLTVSTAVHSSNRLHEPKRTSQVFDMPIKFTWSSGGATHELNLAGKQRQATLLDGLSRATTASHGVSWTTGGNPARIADASAVRYIAMTCVKASGPGRGLLSPSQLEQLNEVPIVRFCGSIGSHCYLQSGEDQYKQS